MSMHKLIQKTWKYLKYSIAIAMSLLFASASILIWLGSRHTTPDKIVGIVGGHEILLSITPPLSSDTQYIRSFTPQQIHDTEKRIMAEACNSPTWECAEANLIIANTMLARGRSIEPALKKVLEQYRNSAAIHEKNCPAKLEITLMSDTLQNIKSTDKTNNPRTSRELSQTLTKALWSHGAPFNLDSFDCRIYFAERPYLAQLYVRRFADLTLKAEGELDYQWRVLIHELPNPTTI